LFVRAGLFIAQIVPVKVMDPVEAPKVCEKRDGGYDEQNEFFFHPVQFKGSDWR
jgi:hypothetical protein